MRHVRLEMRRAMPRFSAATPRRGVMTVLPVIDAAASLRHYLRHLSCITRYAFDT